MERLKGPGGTLEKINSPSPDEITVRGETSAGGFWPLRKRVMSAPTTTSPSLSVMVPEMLPGIASGGGVEVV
jgi:hypothetical protein